MNAFKILILLIASFQLVKSSNNYDDKIMENTCLGRYTGVFHSFIYVAKNETSTDYYAIRTAWMITYPSKIKEKLQEKGLYIHEDNIEKCGWKLISKVTNFIIYTGFIYVKNNEDKDLNTIISEILHNTYPTTEIMMSIFIPIGFIVILIVIYVMYDNLRNRPHYVSQC